MTERLSAIALAHDGLDEQVRIAVRQIEAVRLDVPGLFWLGGFKSVMTGGKASHIAKWAQASGLGMTRFDYSGHGESTGRFEDGTISRWLAEAEAVLALTKGPLVLIGSSMGGFLALLLAHAMKRRFAGAVLVAPAIDMTERLMWDRFPAAVRQTILEQGAYMQPSAYGDGSYPIMRALIEDGRAHLFGGRPVAPGCPVRILHGMQDSDVPWQISQELVSQIDHEDVVLQLIKDGDHRLSRSQDLARLEVVLAELAIGSN